MPAGMGGREGSVSRSKGCTATAIMLAVHVCEGGVGKIEEPCAYCLTSYACALDFSEAVHYL